MANPIVSRLSLGGARLQLMSNSTFIYISLEQRNLHRTELSAEHQGKLLGIFT